MSKKLKKTAPLPKNPPAEPPAGVPAEDRDAGAAASGADRPTLLRLFLTLLKIGAFTFGGGYAMIALLQREFTEKNRWLGKDEFFDLVAIAESTPGPLAVNGATYIGYKIRGIAGAALCTLGVCLPSFVIIYAISLFFDAFLSLEYVTYAFRGIQACVTYLILSAGIKMIRGLKKDVFHVTVLCLCLAVMVAFSLLAVSFSSIYYILICGFLGLFWYLVRRLRRPDRK